MIVRNRVNDFRRCVSSLSGCGRSNDQSCLLMWKAFHRHPSFIKDFLDAHTISLVGFVSLLMLNEARVNYFKNAMNESDWLASRHLFVCLSNSRYETNFSKIFICILQRILKLLSNRFFKKRLKRGLLENNRNKVRPKAPLKAQEITLACKEINVTGDGSAMTRFAFSVWNRSRGDLSESLTVLRKVAKSSSWLRRLGKDSACFICSLQRTTQLMARKQ